MGISRNAVWRVLVSQDPPQYLRPSGRWSVDVLELQVRAWLQQFPDMPATEIAEWVGWSGVITVVRARIAQLRPLNPVLGTSYAPGALAQFDL